MAFLMTNESDSVQSLPVVMADEQKRTREAERRNFILLLALNEGFAGFYSAVHLFFPTILFGLGLAFTIINQDKKKERGYCLYRWHQFTSIKQHLVWSTEMFKLYQMNRSKNVTQNFHNIHS